MIYSLHYYTTFRFCVALSKPNRKRRLVNAFKHLQEDGDAIRGKFLIFIICINLKVVNKYLLAIVMFPLNIA